MGAGEDAGPAQEAVGSRRAGGKYWLLLADWLALCIVLHSADATAPNGRIPVPCGANGDQRQTGAGRSIQLWSPTMHYSETYEFT